MGNTCTPDKKPGDAPAADMEKTKAEAQEEIAEQEATGNAQPGEKFSQIINEYQAENERLKKENEEMKKQETQREADVAKDSQANDQLLQELATMRALVQEKDAVVIKSKLEAALHQRATNLFAAEKNAKLLISDDLEKFGRGGRGNAKRKYVEVTLYKGVHTDNSFQPGVIKLSYADSKDAAQQSTGRVHKVREATTVGARYEGRSFTIVAFVDGVEKDLVFACKDVASKDKWVKAFTDGFKDITQEVEDQQKPFTLKLEFNKEKLGIRVEEKVIQMELPAPAEDIPEPAPEPADAATEEDKADASGDKACEGDAAEKAADEGAEKAADEGAEKAAEEPAAAPAAAEEPAPAPAAAEEPAKAAAAAEEPKEEQKEPSCTLVVTAITDEDLKKKGLVEQMSLVSLNDKELVGLPYSQQLQLLTKTEKPFKITFTGAKYLQMSTVGATAYPEILKQLLADEANDSKKAFYTIIKDTTFEKELNASDNKAAMIEELMNNQRKLNNLLQSVTINTADL